jgi:hypothetical protein
MTERFTALQDFFCDVTKSQYITGLNYNIDNEPLRARVEQWVKEGKVGVIENLDARVTGIGTVS